MNSVIVNKAEVTDIKKVLTSFIERVERLESEKADLAADIKDVYTELKSQGFDAKIVRKIVRMRRVDRQKRLEEQSLLETYMASLGMVD